MALCWAGASRQAHFYKSFAELAAVSELHLISASIPNAGMALSSISSSPQDSHEVTKSWVRLRPAIPSPFHYHKDSRRAARSEGRARLSVVSRGIGWHQSSLVQGCSALISASRSASLHSTETTAPTATAPKPLSNGALHNGACVKFDKTFTLPPRKPNIKEKTFKQLLTASLKNKEREQRTTIAQLLPLDWVVWNNVGLLPSNIDLIAGLVTN